MMPYQVCKLIVSCISCFVFQNHVLIILTYCLQEEEEARQLKEARKAKRAEQNVKSHTLTVSKLDNQLHFLFLYIDDDK